MTLLLPTIILMLSISSVLTSSYMSVSATQSKSRDLSVSTGFGEDLESRIQQLVSDALNDTDNILNSSTLFSNLSNLSSSNIIISNNKVISTINNTGTDDSSSSLVKNQIKTIDGVCNSTKVGGNGNDTLASSGNCNDEFTGGAGSDKFQCGEGNDEIEDFNPKEGDVIIDKQNCEKIL